MSPPREFTVDELRGQLPGGWVLTDPADPGGWDAAAERWRAAVRDGAGVDRELVIERAAIERHGRPEALRRAVDTLYRRALR